MSDPETSEPQTDSSEVDEHEEEPSGPPPQPLSSKAGTYFRVVRYILFVGMIGLGSYFLYDGYVGYPSHNAKFDEIRAKGEAAAAAGRKDDAAKLAQELTQLGAKHDPFQITFQKIIGYSLIPIAG